MQDSLRHEPNYKGSICNAVMVEAAFRSCSSAHIKEIDLPITVELLTSSERLIPIAGTQFTKTSEIETPSLRFPLQAGGTSRRAYRGSPREAGGTCRRGAIVNFARAIGISPSQLCNALSVSRGSGSQQGQSPSGAIAYGVLDPL